MNKCIFVSNNGDGCNEARENHTFCKKHYETVGLYLYTELPPKDPTAPKSCVAQKFCVYTITNDPSNFNFSDHENEPLKCTSTSRKFVSILYDPEDYNDIIYSVCSDCYPVKNGKSPSIDTIKNW